jgi:hypothetical protein
MSIPTYRAVEPLYIVMLRNNQAEPMFKTWIRKHQIEHATVAGNRMMLHHQQAFDRRAIHSSSQAQREVPSWPSRRHDAAHL